MAESKILDSVVSQPDAYTCQSACIAKVLGTADVLGIRAELEALGEPGSPAVMGVYLRRRVREYQFLLAGSLNDARRALDSGYTVITHGWLSPSGHVLTLVGVEPDPGTGSYRFIVDDPYGEFDFISASYDTSVIGDDLRYSSYGLYAYCVASQDYWHAQRLYAERRLNPAEKNAWLHLIKN